MVYKLPCSIKIRPDLRKQMLFLEFLLQNFQDEVSELVQSVQLRVFMHPRPHIGIDS